MNTLIEYFTAALRFFRSAAKTKAPEPDHADGQNWLTAPASTRTWEAVLSAQPQQADPTNR